MKISVVFGAGGFIGSHLVELLRKEGRFVVGVDRHLPRFQNTHANVFHIGNIRDSEFLLSRIRYPVDEVYQLCAFLGGAGIIDSKKYDADIFMNNMSVNLSVLNFCKQRSVSRIFFASSACVYKEGSDDISPVNVYGWEKLASETMYSAYGYQYSAQIRIGRLYNIYGPRQEFRGGRERVLSALCRKVLEDTDTLVIFGNGKQTRTFLHVADCVNAIYALTQSDLEGPVNIGSSRAVSIDELAQCILRRAGRLKRIVHTDDSDTPNVRLCDTRRIQETGWTERVSLEDGVCETYDWILQSLLTISRINDSNV